MRQNEGGNNSDNNENNNIAVNDSLDDSLENDEYLNSSINSGRFDSAQKTRPTSYCGAFIVMFLGATCAVFISIVAVRTFNWKAVASNLFPSTEIRYPQI